MARLSFKMKKYWINSLIVLSVLLVTIILAFFTSGTDIVIELLSTMKYQWIAVAFLCIFIYWMGDALSLHLIIKRFYRNKRFAESARISMIGAFFNTITPFSSGGQPAQMYFMTKNGIPPGQSLTFVFVRSLISQTVIVLYSIVIIIFKGGYFAERVSGFFLLYLLGLLIYMAILAVYLLLVFRPDLARRINSSTFRFIRKVKFLKKFVKYEDKVETELELYKNSATTIKSNLSLFPKVALVQVIRQTFFYSIPFLIYLAAEVGKPEWFNMVAAQSMVSILSSIIPSPGGAGGAEGAGYVFFGLFFTTVPVIAVLLIWRIITHYSGMIFGGIFTMSAMKKNRKIDNKEETAKAETATQEVASEQ